MSTYVIGVDGTDRSDDALTFATQLARTTNAEVFVASAYEGRHEREGALTTARAATRAVATPFAALAHTSSLSPHRRRATGGSPPRRARARAISGPNPAKALHDLALALQAELVIVGATHTGRFGRIVPGATGEQLLRDAPYAVAVVPAGYRVHPIEWIGVAYDRSDSANAALAYAERLAEAFGAAVEVIEVLDEDPVQSLVERSQRLDLLVTGTRGLKPLRAVITGGVSGRLQRAAACPVIAVPAA